MSTTTRNLPRFLPTLTEVVQPPGLARTSAAVMPDFEDMVQSVMQRVNLTIERRLLEETDALVRTLVTDPLQDLRLRIRQELEMVVRQAVLEAMRSRADPDKSK